MIVYFVCFRQLWTCPGVLLCTAPRWSRCSASHCACSCGRAGWRTRGVRCPGCCSSLWRHTTYGTECATACGSGPSPTRHRSPTGCTSPSRPPSLTSVLCSCTWPAPETWSLLSTAWPSTSDLTAFHMLCDKEELLFCKEMFALQLCELKFWGSAAPQLQLQVLLVPLCNLTSSSGVNFAIRVYWLL